MDLFDQGDVITVTCEQQNAVDVVIMNVLKGIDDHGDIDALAFRRLLALLKDSWSEVGRQRRVSMGLEPKPADRLADFLDSLFIPDDVRVIRCAYDLFHTDAMRKRAVPD